MTTPVTARRRTPDVVAEVVGRQVASLQDGYLADRGSAVAALAQLRRGAGKLPSDVPELWGTTGTEQLYQQLPDLARSETEATRAENALFLALTLYALHQQSHRTARMHRPGIELGAAVRRLSPGEEPDGPIRRRFVRVGAAATPDTLAHPLREIVSLLRGAAIPLDYALLAHRLYQAQTSDGMAEVRRRWGRSFHAHHPAADQAANAAPDAGPDAGPDAAAPASQSTHPNEDAS
ncbi:type I-E CRISPR-associated protein Cse2/CasB [Actinomadura kijaniata]|uniref:type I-E CRISPR-associated protein Cse2/CasB n=1 Tax=Actinomadura kijaniata TaxID=46161 RepID=UPI003F1AB880